MDGDGCEMLAKEECNLGRFNFYIARIYKLSTVTKGT